MKHLAFILSIYILSLVSAPCADEVLHAGSLSSRQTGHHQQDVPSDHADGCSPFCICSCCSVPVTIAPGTFICQPFFSFRRAIRPEPSQILSLFAVNFWQPPKLS
jgi:hypothetical protein